MIRLDADERVVFDFEHRTAAAEDPVNALLSLAHSLLARTSWSRATPSAPAYTLASTTSLPSVGPRSHSVSLGAFARFVADSAALTALNTDMVCTDDLTRRGEKLSRSRRGDVEAWSAPSSTAGNHLVTQPIFRYRVSYPGVLEIQRRLLVIGKIPAYTGFLREGRPGLPQHGDYRWPLASGTLAP
jgi:hypothetical protein